MATHLINIAYKCTGAKREHYEENCEREVHGSGSTQCSYKNMKCMIIDISSSNNAVISNWKIVFTPYWFFETVFAC